MATEIVVPNIGESIIEATVGAWQKQEGDRVAPGDVLVELETHKVNLEVGAPHAGVLVRIERKQGEDVKVGDVLALLEEVSEKTGGAPARPEAAPAREAAPQPQEEPAPVAAQDGGRATPVARRMALGYGIPLDQVPATGPGGQVTKEDIQRYLEERQAARQAPPPPPPPAARPVEREAPPAPPVQPAERKAAPALPAPAVVAQPPEERIRMSRRRQTIARRLVEAQQTAAMLTTFNEIDMSAVQELRRRRKESFKERYGVSLGIMGFFVKATIGALKAFPRLNAEIQGNEIVLKRYYNIGIAVGAEEGLIVPVLRDADRMSFAEIEKAIGDFVQKAQDGTLSLEDLRGSTFTITNGGVFGSLLSTPILNPPEVGILGMHKIEERPVALNGQIVIRPMMYVALSYDHRIVDGREAVQFLVRVKQLVEDPETLLLEG